MKIKIPKFLKKKRNIWIIIIAVIIIIILFFIFRGKKNPNGIQQGTATIQNLQETVLATGQVISGTDLDLSFQSSGVVKRVLVKEGDKVSKGNLLASLDESSALASLTTAQGSLAQAQANYEKLMAGATEQTVKTSQDSVNSAKQDLSNAYNSSINTLNSGYTALYNADRTAISIQTTYFNIADPPGIQVQNSRNDLDTLTPQVKQLLDAAQKSMAQQDIDSLVTKEIFALNNAYNDINVIRSQADSPSYNYTVAASDKSLLDAQKTALNVALTGVNTLQQNIASLTLALQKTQDQLSVTTAPPTQAEIDLAKAQILSAQGQVYSAQATLSNMEIRAPEDGTITQVDIKAGEQATPSKEVLILQNVNDLHAEANVSEANIASLQQDQDIDYTFDALGPDKHFAGKVLTINPASTVISGVVNYLVKGSLDNVPGIKPGMTANMTIMVAKKENALAVPSTAVINKDGKNYVRVVDNINSGKYHEVEVQTGLQADGGLVEITSGLSNNQKIIVYMKQ